MAELTVLHYTGYNHDHGGIISVVRALASAGEFHCVLGVNRGCMQQRYPAMPVLELPRITGEKINLHTCWRARTVARAVQTWLRADPNRVFHGHSRAGLLVGLWLHAMGEQRVIATVHCYGAQRWFYRWAARRMGERLFWLSPTMKRHYRLKCGGEPWSQCIPACVPVGSSLAERRSLRGVARERLRLGGVGALVDRKRWHLIVEALALLPATVRKRVSFHHVGSRDDSEVSGQYAASLRVLAAARGVEEMIQWLGEQPSADMLLTEIDCFVLPSRNEPFAVAMLEALQAGVPVLAADSGGARDVIEAGENGWFFRTDDAGDLARKIEILAESDAIARSRIDPERLRRFTAPVVAERWLSVYRRLMAEA